MIVKKQKRCSCYPRYRKITSNTKFKKASCHICMVDLQIPSTWENMKEINARAGKLCEGCDSSAALESVSFDG